MELETLLWKNWKQRLLNAWVAYDLREQHTMLAHLSVLRALDVAPVAELVVSWRAADEQQAVSRLAALDGKRHVVLHLFPKFHYKMWQDDAWLDFARWISARGFAIVLTMVNFLPARYAFDLFGAPARLTPAEATLSTPSLRSSTS